MAGGGAAMRGGWRLQRGAGWLLVPSGSQGRASSFSAFWFLMSTTLIARKGRSTAE